MDRSRLRAAAIRWVIACGVLYGGAGMLGGALAAADPDSVGSSHDGRDGGGGSTSNDNHGGSGVKDDNLGGRTERRGTGRANGGLGASDELVGAPRRGPVRAAAATDPGGEDPGRVNWPWPWPWPPCEGHTGGGVGGTPGTRGVGTPPGSVSNGGGPRGSGGGGNSGGLPPTNFPPPTQPGQPGEPSVANAESGAVTPAGTEPGPITMPAVIGLPPALEVPLRAPGGAGPASELGPGGRGNPAETSAGREPLPAGPSRTTAVPESFRLGYPEYLRDAKIGDVAVLALPGFAGIVALTALGGFVGYRQAKAGHVVRAAGTARFLQ